MLVGMNHSQLWLVRHGETEWSAAGRHTGRTDVPLTDAGRAAAKRLATILPDQTFDLILSSPLRRALDTCELAGFAGGVLTTSDLSEWDYGEYEGITTDQIRHRRPGWTLFFDGCPGGETLDQVAARADRVIARVREVNGPVIAFAHGHILRVVGARWIGAPAVVGANLVLSTATVSVLGYERESPAILRWNLA
jgi:probable phosphoglycerate mutase